MLEWRRAAMLAAAVLLAGCSGGAGTEGSPMTLIEPESTEDPLPAEGDPTGPAEPPTFRTIDIDVAFDAQAWACARNPLHGDCSGLLVGGLPVGPLIDMDGILVAVDLRVTSEDPVTIWPRYYLQVAVMDEVPCEGLTGCRKWEGHAVGRVEGNLTLVMDQAIDEPVIHESFTFVSGPEEYDSSLAAASLTSGYRVSGTITVQDPPRTQPSS